MASLPSFQHLRKSTATLGLVLLAFVAHRLVVGFRPASQTAAVAEAPSPARSIVCRNIVGGEPFGIDSLFETKRNRVYVVSYWNPRELVRSDSLIHRWYLGGKAVLVESCAAEKGWCASSISPDLLEKGEWSVDLVQGRHLLSSRQFLVLGDVL